MTAGITGKARRPKCERDPQGALGLGGLRGAGTAACQPRGQQLARRLGVLSGPSVPPCVFSPQSTVAHTGLPRQSHGLAVSHQPVPLTACITRLAQGPARTHRGPSGTFPAAGRVASQLAEAGRVPQGSLLPPSLWSACRWRVRTREPCLHGLVLSSRRSATPAALRLRQPVVLLRLGPPWPGAAPPGGAAAV